MEDWPLHSACTSDGDDRDVFALAATLVIWVIAQVPECHEAMMLYSSRLFVALLFHVVITTKQMPPVEAGHFWRACQEEHRLPSKSNREMRRHLVPLCSGIALHLLRQLSREDPYRDLPFLAFLVEARRMCILSPSLLELLDDAEGEMVSMTLRAFTNVLQHKDILVSSTTAPKLAESLLLLFDHDNSHVQVLSIQLFSKVVELVVDEGKMPLKTIVDKSLYTLALYCHDENLDVAKASRETLLRVAKFLKRRRLVQLLKKQPPMNVEEALLAEDRSRAAEHLRRALRYLRRPQERLREAADTFMGMAGRCLRRQQQELRLIWTALQARRQRASPSCRDLENQAEFPQRAEELGTSSGSSQPVPQEEHQETPKRTSPPSTAGSPGTADAGQSSCGFSPLPAC
ncbi:uncharacterized protein LOC141730416 [Zonotrichia albicollis]|uniref:uncharacterized protein LOC141730416 n=1 Tax=Zonotrichia albicollis TaxID=44394 RepID=UPI003D80DFDA